MMTATPATHRLDNPVTVATVTVAEALYSKPWDFRLVRRADRVRDKLVGAGHLQWRRRETQGDALERLRAADCPA